MLETVFLFRLSWETTTCKVSGISCFIDEKLRPREVTQLPKLTWKSHHVSPSLLPCQEQWALSECSRSEWLNGCPGTAMVWFRCVCFESSYCFPCAHSSLYKQKQLQPSLKGMVPEHVKQKLSSMYVSEKRPLCKVAPAGLETCQIQALGSEQALPDLPLSPLPSWGPSWSLCDYPGSTWSKPALCSSLGGSWGSL